MPLASRQAVMAEHHARTWRQRPDRGQQRRADAFVGHQPRMTPGRQIAVQIGHHPAIASVMTADTLSPPAPSALHNVTTAIAQAAHIAGRKAEAVTLIAVSKTHDAVSRAKTEVLHRILTHYLPLYFPEVDRFRHNSRSDWFFAFLDHAAEHGDESLARMLVDEMFATERRVKKEGRGAGGMRPLRMWRGD